jgi:hypothetical protein
VGSRFHSLPSSFCEAPGKEKPARRIYFQKGVGSSKAITHPEAVKNAWEGFQRGVVTHLREIANRIREVDKHLRGRCCQMTRHFYSVHFGHCLSLLRNHWSMYQFERQPRRSCHLRTTGHE